LFWPLYCLFFVCFAYCIVFPSLFLQWPKQRSTDNTMAKTKKYRQYNGQNKEAQNDNQRSTQHTHKSKDRVTRTPLKSGGELRCSGRVSSSSVPLSKSEVITVLRSLPWLGWQLWNICVTHDHGYVPLVVSSSRSFPHSRPITRFVTRLTRRVPLVEEELIPVQEELEDTKGIIRIRKSKDRQHNGQKKKYKKATDMFHLS
jgi:hypothetical protein